MIEVLSFIGSEIKTEFAAEGLYRLSGNAGAVVYTSDGTLHYSMKAGFPTDMRSGSHAIDWLIPKFTGNNHYNLALLCHDFAYTRNREGSHYISRELADELLRQMCVLSGELGKARAAIMHRAVRLFGQGAYEAANTGDFKDAGLFMDFRWGDR